MLEPVAVTVIVPSLSIGQVTIVGLVFDTLPIVGVVGWAVTTVAVAVDTQLLTSSFTTTWYAPETNALDVADA